MQVPFFVDSTAIEAIDTGIEQITNLSVTLLNPMLFHL